MSAVDLTRIDITNFKNYERAKVRFDRKVNLIFGDNGSGKTNFLDAIHFLCVSKSYFSMSDKHLVKHDADFYRVVGHFQSGEKTDQLTYKYRKDGKRTIQRNMEKIVKVRDLIGQFPVVLIAPDDINIVKGSSKNRRDYFNKWLCQSDTSYLQALVMHNRILRQKDALLKSDRTPSVLSVQAFNHQLIPLAIQIHNKLTEIIEDFSEKVYDQYQKISSGKDQIRIEYKSDLTGVDCEKLFEEFIAQEIRAKRPLVGVQRDDFDFLIEERPLKKYGSQGQIKSLLYSLRLAEYEHLYSKIAKKPILILDDYFEKLDSNRLSSLLSLLGSDHFGQVFLSDTEVERSKKIFDERGIQFDSFYVEEGQIALVN